MPWRCCSPARARVTAFDRAIKSGVYDLQSGMPLFRLRGRTLGLLGFGRIGRAMARKASAFGFHVIACDPFLEALAAEAAGIVPVSFSELLERSEYISIHVPSTPETRCLFGREAFRRMKPGAILINTARGDIIDEGALLWALDSGEIAGAGLDVLCTEPPDPADPLIRHPKVVVTPHAAFNSEESLLELQATAATQMAAVLAGEMPQFVVNPEVLQRPNLRAVFKNTAGGNL